MRRRGGDSIDGRGDVSATNARERGEEFEDDINAMKKSRVRARSTRFVTRARNSKRSRAAEQARQRRRKVASTEAVERNETRSTFEIMVVVN